MMSIPTNPERKPPIMGDRANVYVKGYGDEPGVYLYTHWTGTELPATVQRALARGTDRWDDNAYLTRIVFAEMIRDELDATTGYGISTRFCDGGDRIIILDCGNQTVEIDGNEVPMKDFVAIDAPQWNSLRRDPNSPMTVVQRRALFAVFDSVFGKRTDAARYAYTRQVLNLSADTTVSWSESKAGSLAYGQAAKVITSLLDLESALK
jgi:hypothetical protein